MGTANTALEFHAGRLLALQEGSLPWHLRVLCDGALETVGACTFDGGATRTFTAHPKVDTLTSEMMFISYQVDKTPHLTYGVLDADGKPVHVRSPDDARAMGIETVYQNLAMSPALSIADNMFLGREWRKPGILGSVFRQMDRPRMEKFARDKLSELGLTTIQNIHQAVESLSGGQRQGVAVARAAAFGSKVVILDEPTAALGVKESRRVLELIRDVRNRGIPIILISHNMPHVFEVCDRVHIHRLGRRLCVIDPKEHSMSDAVAYMTGAKLPEGVTEAA
jgi:fructose transport system ATP-binding protein